MTAIDYAALAAEALQAIADAGVDATVSAVKEGTPPDASRPWRVAASNPSDPAHTAGVKVCMFSYKPDQMERANGAILKGDRKAFIPHPGFDVEQGYIVTLQNGERWSVVGASAVPPLPLVVVWSMQVRRWPQRTTG